MSKLIKNIRKISNIPETCVERYLDLRGEAAAPLKTLGIYYSGISFLKSGYRIGSPDHQGTYIVIFTKSGMGHLFTSQGETIMTGGTVTVIPAWEPCLWSVYRDEWTILWFHCRETPWWHDLQGRVLYKPTAVIPRLENAMTGYLQETAVLQEAPENESAAALYGRLIALHLTQALREHDAIGGCRIDMDKLWDDVRNALNKDWSAAAMAKKLNLSVATLQRRCLEYYSRTPRQILIGMRMEQAETLLTCTDYPLKTIAGTVGYADEFIFSSSFKKSFGISPKTYRSKSIRARQSGVLNE
jgi:AraC-like DNA-binding protein